MNIHFHYYCVRVLAKTAGFSEQEAETIAYASQYVDDATEHKPMDIHNAPAEADDQHIAGLFDPVCTAHSMLQYTGCMRPESQRKVYIPFHFLPPEKYAAGAHYQFRVEPDSNLARELLAAALDSLRAAPRPDTDRLRALIKVGIALHTYADTWAHAGFSGRHSSEDNDIQNRERLSAGEWKKLGFFERAAYDAAPDVGHAEAGTMPDASDLHWRYTREEDDKLVTRGNTDEFVAAATAILTALCSVRGINTALPAGVRACLATENEHSFKVWSAAFPAVFDGSEPYDPKRWRKEALGLGTVEWDGYTEADEFAQLHFEATGELEWFLFHAEAGKQRDFVLRRIKRDLK